MRNILAFRRHSDVIARLDDVAADVGMALEKAIAEPDTMGRERLMVSERLADLEWQQERIQNEIAQHERECAYLREEAARIRRCIGANETAARLLEDDASPVLVA